MAITKSCSVCNGELVVKTNARHMHRECIGEATRRRNLGRSTATPAPIYADPRGLAEFIREQAPPMATPVGRPLDDLRNQKKHNQARIAGTSPLAPFRQCVFDIETTGLDAGFGRVLCAVIQAYDPNELFVFRADQYPDWKAGRRASDRDIVGDILAVLEKMDIAVAHNGVRFDMPFLRTRALLSNLPVVHLNMIVDPCLLARNVFRFPSNSLNMISNLLETSYRKTPLSPVTWQKASLDGDTEALDDIVEHCVADVYVLEQVCSAIRGYFKKLDSFGSFRR